MKEICMYYSVKSMFDLGKNISQIARNLHLDRKTVFIKNIDEGLKVR
ncbi:hypothetical protein TDSAC_0074 [Thermodesulfobium acidiphilum]|uniref:Transposase n=1 Tax=Thermodesulfobium acidiphilum TaxID=1794699 RepID=A0A2R4VYC5_THEAF|nr:hypothetical protein [Thermodesulfobium acidiphilum]AWB09464.1 hypothetical protein TDSAC_0074 [Thermodesulfobium acidiphilum]